MLAARLLPLLAITCAFVGGCSSDPGQSPTTNTAPEAPVPTPVVPVPDEEDVHDVAENEYSALDTGDWSGAWELWSAEAQDVISEDDFERVNDQCSPVVGAGYKIIEVRKPSPTKAIVRWQRLDIVGSHEFRQDKDGWHFQPSADELAGYRLGADELIRRKRSEGTCG